MQFSACLTVIMTLLRRSADLVCGGCLQGPRLPLHCHCPFPHPAGYSRGGKPGSRSIQSCSCLIYLTDCITCCTPSGLRLARQTQFSKHTVVQCFRYALKSRINHLALCRHQLAQQIRSSKHTMRG